VRRGRRQAAKISHASSASARHCHHSWLACRRCRSRFVSPSVQSAPGPRAPPTQPAAAVSSSLAYKSPILCVPLPLYALRPIAPASPGKSCMRVLPWPTCGHAWRLAPLSSVPAATSRHTLPFPPRWYVVDLLSLPLNIYHVMYVSLIC
jgi:hypothetical protein